LEAAMTAVASRPATQRPGMRRGAGGSVLALARAMGFSGLLVIGAALLVGVAGPVVLTALGLGRLIDNLLRQGIINQGISLGGDNARNLLAVFIGLACCRFVLPAALLATRRLVMLTRRLSARWCGVPIASAYRPTSGGPGRLSYQQRMSVLLGDAATWRDLLWLSVNAVVGPVLLLGPVTLAGVGAIAFLVPALGSLAWFRGMQHLVPPPAFPGNTPLVLFIIGLAFVALGLWAGPWTLRGYAGLARLVLAPSGQAELELRVRHLAQTRKESLDTGAAELRRIERDLHDGAQARLVAMGLTLDAAGRLIDTDPAAARALLIEARDASARALAELRDLVRGIHPPVLADRGLVAAVRALVLDGPLRVRVSGSLDGRPPAPVESAAYFAISELLANVAKHSGAGAAEADLRHCAGALRISVRDDGAGGADPSRGTGLHGIERRLAAFDGVLAVSSPVGGPTVITMEVPCVLS
jgi:signal transduction histidine kinase